MLKEPARRVTDLAPVVLFILAVVVIAFVAAGAVR
jgi:hypothetical protein